MEWRLSFKMNTCKKLDLNRRYIIRGKTYRLKQIYDNKHDMIIADGDDLNINLESGWVKSKDVTLTFVGDGTKRYSYKYFCGEK